MPCGSCLAEQGVLTTEAGLVQPVQLCPCLPFKGSPRQTLTQATNTGMAPACCEPPSSLCLALAPFHLQARLSHLLAVQVAQGREHTFPDRLANAVSTTMRVFYSNCSQWMEIPVPWPGNWIQWTGCRGGRDCISDRTWHATLLWDCAISVTHSQQDVNEKLCQAGSGWEGQGGGQTVAGLPGIPTQAPHPQFSDDTRLSRSAQIKSLQ